MLTKARPSVVRDRLRTCDCIRDRFNLCLLYPNPLRDFIERICLGCFAKMVKCGTASHSARLCRHIDGPKEHRLSEYVPRASVIALYVSQVTVLRHNDEPISPIAGNIALPKKLPVVVTNQERGVSPASNEVLIVPTAFDQQPCDTQQQDAVGPWSNA